MGSCDQEEGVVLVLPRKMKAKVAVALQEVRFITRLRKYLTEVQNEESM